MGISEESSPWGAALEGVPSPWLFPPKSLMGWERTRIPRVAPPDPRGDPGALVRGWGGGERGVRRVPLPGALSGAPAAFPS